MTLCTNGIQNGRVFCYDPSAFKPWSRSPTDSTQLYSTGVRRCGHLAGQLSWAETGRHSADVIILKIQLHKKSPVCCQSGRARPGLLAGGEGPGCSFPKEPHLARPRVSRPPSWNHAYAPAIGNWKTPTGSWRYVVYIYLDFECLILCMPKILSRLITSRLTESDDFLSSWVQLMTSPDPTHHSIQLNCQLASSLQWPQRSMCCGHWTGQLSWTELTGVGPQAMWSVITALSVHCSRKNESQWLCRAVPEKVYKPGLNQITAAVEFLSPPLRALPASSAPRIIRGSGLFCHSRKMWLHKSLTVAYTQMH